MSVATNPPESPPSEPRDGRSLWMVGADALAVAFMLLVVECLAVGVLARRELAGAHELGIALIDVLPIGLALAAPVALLGAILARGLDPEGEPEGRAAGLARAIPTALWAAAVGIGVSGGRQLAGGRRPVFVVVFVAVSVGAAWWAGPPLARILGRLRERPPSFLGAVAAVVLALDILNMTVLSRLYLAFHVGLAVLSVWAALWLMPLWRGVRHPRGRALGAWAVVVVAAAFAPTAAKRLSLRDNLRWVFGERAPRLRHAVALAARLAPPAPLAPDDGPVPFAPAGETVDLSGRDLLLVTVDALRADHVGAYGYARATTPALDGLARTGLTFDAAYTVTPHTSYALTSLMTGKYMRPLLLQGVAGESRTWAEGLRTYGFRTAAFYPPAAFFVDRARFRHFEESGFGFEYRKVEFASAAKRAEQLEAYLADADPERRLFVWVHLFEPHEPYVAHPEHPFGERSIDRYDSEIAAADAGLAKVVAAMRKRRPRAVVVVSADHGEEFGDHGGRYHGTTVYEEQVRVPLVVDAPGAVTPGRVARPVGLVDLMPTLLRAMRIPVSPRVRGRDLGPLLAGRGRDTLAAAGRDDSGFAFSETDDQTLLAQGALRLVCDRRHGACRLYDVKRDPGQLHDASAENMEAAAAMKKASAQFVSSLGRYERSTGPRWPRALRRGIAGDVDAAGDVAALLDDADPRIRRRAAEVLFELGRVETAPQLRRALRRDEERDVRVWCALALTRVGQGAPLTFDLLRDDAPRLRRLAALALAEQGDARGEAVLLDWWRKARGPEASEPKMPFFRAKQVIAALSHLRSRKAALPLAESLGDVRLRKHIAEALAIIGDKVARPSLADALARERYHDARLAMARALVKLGGRGELRGPLAHFMGVPDPLPEGVALALEAKQLPFVGGPAKRAYRRMLGYAHSGVAVGIVVPEAPSDAPGGLRTLVLARSRDGLAGQVRVGLQGGPPTLTDGKHRVPKKAPRLDPALTVTLPVRAGDREAHQIDALLPATVAERVKPGEHGEFIVYATQNVELLAFVVVPTRRAMPPPAPEPWRP